MDPIQLSADEYAVIQRGNIYRELKGTTGWKLLSGYMYDYCIARLSDLEKDEHVEPIATARLVDRWKAAEAMYQSIMSEVDGSIRTADEKKKELEPFGFNELEMPIKEG